MILEGRNHIECVLASKLFKLKKIISHSNNDHSLQLAKKLVYYESLNKRKDLDLLNLSQQLSKLDSSIPTSIKEIEHYERIIGSASQNKESEELRILKAQIKELEQVIKKEKMSAEFIKSESSKMKTEFEHNVEKLFLIESERLEAKLQLFLKREFNTQLTLNKYLGQEGENAIKREECLDLEYARLNLILLSENERAIKKRPSFSLYYNSPLKRPIRKRTPFFSRDNTSKSIPKQYYLSMVNKSVLTRSISKHKKNTSLTKLKPIDKTLLTEEKEKIKERLINEDSLQIKPSSTRKLKTKINEIYKIDKEEIIKPSIPFIENEKSINRRSSSFHSQKLSNLGFVEDEESFNNAASPINIHLKLFQGRNGRQRNTVMATSSYINSKPRSSMFAQRLHNKLNEPSKHLRRQDSVTSTTNESDVGKAYYGVLRGNGGSMFIPTVNKYLPTIDDVKSCNSIEQEALNENKDIPQTSVIPPEDSSKSISDESQYSMSEHNAGSVALRIPPKRNPKNKTTLNYGGDNFLNIPITQEITESQINSRKEFVSSAEEQPLLTVGFQRRPQKKSTTVTWGFIPSEKVLGVKDKNAAEPIIEEPESEYKKRRIHSRTRNSTFQLIKAVMNNDKEEQNVDKSIISEENDTVSQNSNVFTVIEANNQDVYYPQETVNKGKRMSIFYRNLNEVRKFNLTPYRTL